MVKWVRSGGTHLIHIQSSTLGQSQDMDEKFDYRFMGFFFNLIKITTPTCLLTLDQNMPRVSHGEICGAVVSNKNPPFPSPSALETVFEFAAKKCFNGQKRTERHRPKKKAGITKNRKLPKLQKKKKRRCGTQWPTFELSSTCLAPFHSHSCLLSSYMALPRCKKPVLFASWIFRPHPKFKK